MVPLGYRPDADVSDSWVLKDVIVIIIMGWISLGRSILTYCSCKWADVPFIRLVTPFFSR